MDEDCEVLIERLSEELAIVKEHLARITHGLESQLTYKLKSTLLPTCEESGPLAQSDSTWSDKEEKFTVQKKLNGAVGHHKDAESQETNMKDLSKEANMKDFLKIVDDREQEREELYKKRLLLMKSHIEHQLKELREKDSYLAKVRERRMKKERALKIQMKPQHFRSSGEDDTAYMLKVYKGAMYHAIDLEHNLKKSGKLNKPADIKSFWDYLFNLDSPSPEAKERVPNQSQSLKTHQKMLTSSSRDVGEEDYCKDYTNSWAITAQQPVEEEDNTSQSGSFQASSNEFSYDKLPKLRSVQEMLGDPVKLRFEITKRQDSANWGRQIERQHMQLQKSYECSKANEILMRTRYFSLLQNIEQSLLSQSDEQLQAIQSPPSPSSQLSSFVVPSALHGSTPYPEPPRTGEQFLHNLPTSPTQESAASTSTASSSGSQKTIPTITPETTSKLSNKDNVLLQNGSFKKSSMRPGLTGHIRKRGTYKFEDNEASSSEQVVPLSMSALMKTSKVVEVKTKGSMWKNYILTET